jgi:CheY-like chemotaxis protein
MGIHSVKLVALSGYCQESDRQRAFAVGFNHYLTKPVSMQELRDLLSFRSNWPSAKSPTSVIQCEDACG